MADYESLTSNCVMSLDNYVADNWAVSQKFLKRHVLARAGFFALAPLSILTTFADTFIGGVSGTLSLITLGKSRKIYFFSADHLSSSKNIIATPYLNLIRTLNPQARFDSEKGIIKRDGNGLITNFVYKKIKKQVSDCYKSSNIFKKHIATRGFFIALGASSVICRVVDGILGGLATPLSFLTFGKFHTINHIAVRGLKAGGMVQDVYYCAVKFINPWTGK